MLDITHCLSYMLYTRCFGRFVGSMSTVGTNIDNKIIKMSVILMITNHLKAGTETIHIVSRIYNVCETMVNI